MHNGLAERIRLWGIDCPESKQAFGTRAKQLTGDLAFGKEVTVRVRDVDRYKRTVAEIILQDGRNLNREWYAPGLLSGISDTRGTKQSWRLRSWKHGRRSRT
jgi:micrococcal nuclease